MCYTQCKEDEDMKYAIWNEILYRYVTEQFVLIMEQAITKFEQKQDGKRAVNMALQDATEWIQQSSEDFRTHSIIDLLTTQFSCSTLLQ